MTEEPALSWVRAQVNKDLSGERGGAGRGEAGERGEQRAEEWRKN